MRLEMFVPGVPVPQGSKSAYVRNGKAVVVEGKGKGQKAHKAWRKLVAQEAAACMDWLGYEPLTGPVSVTLSFYMPRGKTVKRVHATVKPDLDKLVRSVLDSLTGTAFVDDSQVVTLLATKVYETPHLSGVAIEVSDQAFQFPTVEGNTGYDC